MSLFDKLKRQAIDAVKEGVKNAANKIVSVPIASIPANLAEFTALPQAALTTPFDTAALTVVALCVYPYNKEASIQMLNHLRGPRPLSNQELSFIADRFRDSDYVPRSYFNGATPDNDYEPQAPYTIVVSDGPYSYQNEGYAKLYIRSGGADNPREVLLRQAKDGKWYLWDQMLLVGIRQPESSNPWA